jgi:putative ABC transport system substrate-binding protein
LKIIEAAAQRLGVELHLVPVQDPKDLERTFSAMVERGVQALVVFPDGMFVAQTAQIIVLAAQTRLPAMYGVREYAAVGGLMTYGANLAEMNRDVGARFVDSILRGAHPGQLSIAQPTKFELLINLKTATALGLTVPRSLRLRADELIQ